jgi:glycoprotein endo-alpha-1,2-mannosidase
VGGQKHEGEGRVGSGSRPAFRLATAALVAVSLVAAGTAAGTRPDEAVSNARVAVFFYPWYGTPGRDGAWRHWDQGGARPPSSIASAFYPARGPYSSRNRTVLAAQLREIRAAGVDEVVASWWGRGSPEDSRLPVIRSVALRNGLALALHVEPYTGRTPATVAADVAYARSLGVRDVYVYAVHDAAAEAWQAALAGAEGVRLFAQTTLVGFAARAGFDGVYTYDVRVHGGDKLGRLCEQARRVSLLCAPSVGPGFDARRAVGDPAVKRRRRGQTYDAMWTAALRARADVVTVTSYNEWHEGTQIEPARAQSGYASYDGAWGRRGRDAQRAYLDRTAEWTARFRASGVPNQ